MPVHFEDNPNNPIRPEIVKVTETLFLDIGANLGYFSQLALALGVDHVMAVEPVLRNAHKLAKSALMYNNFTKDGRSGDDRLTLYNYAVGNPQHIDSE